MDKSFREYLKEYKAKNVLTNTEMAKRLGISVKMYTNYESGKFQGEPTKVKKYVDKLRLFDLRIEQLSDILESTRVDLVEEPNQQHEADKVIIMPQDIELMRYTISLQKEMIEILKKEVQELKAIRN